MTVPIPEFSIGCEWPIDPACLTAEWDALSEQVKHRATMLASNTMRRLTGYRVGGCPVTVRPCKQGESCGALGYAREVPYYGQYAGFNPHIGVGGQWINSCGCQQDCSCTTICEVHLPAPVRAVTEVKVDGDVIAPENYRVDGSALLWVGEGECPWPACQDMTALDGEGTFIITYLNGYPVDALGAYAAGVLAMEYAKACTGSKCRLPSGVTSVARQGVSYEIQSGAFPGGFTGIREVDAYLGLWNPGALRQAPTVWSPDIASGPRVIG